MNRLLPVVLASLLAVSLLVAACAKRPALVQSAAPAPTGAAVTAAPPAPAEAPAASPPAAAPAPMTPPPPKEFEARTELLAIHFDFDKYAIRSGDAKILEANAEWLKSNPDALILIEGHCDERGTNEYNMALGDRRARATMNYLLAQGVKSSRMSTISYGEERPLCTEHNESCWSQNRRAELKIKPR